MSHKSSLGHLALISLSFFALSGCFHPPYNNFKPYHRPNVTTGPGAVVGTAAVAVAGGPIALGALAGGTLGAAVGYYKNTKPALVRELNKFNISYIEYGDTITFVIPTDKYFVFDSAHLNDICYAGLETLIKVIKTFHSCCPIYVAGFTDNVGSRQSKQLMSQARAETMLTFLWAHDIPAKRLQAEGYGDKHTVGDNNIIHGSAYNRRIEIQIIKNCSAAGAEPAQYLGPTK